MRQWKDMTAIDHLKASDTMRFDTIAYHLSAPVIGDSDSTILQVCIAKPPGALAFTFTSKDLLLPIPGLVLPFTGKASGNEVTWSIDQPLDTWYSAAHLTHVRGEFVTRVDDLWAPLGQSCAGAPRAQ